MILSFRAHELSVSFGPERVLNGVSLELLPGERCLLLGANGSGKSTFLRCCSGLVSPGSGRITIGDRELRGRELRAAVGHLGHFSFLYPALTVRENLAFYRDLRGDASPLDALLDEWELAGVAAKKVESLSKGFQTRVSLCRAFLGDPGQLFLDEPSAPLDEHGVAILRRRLEASPRASFLIATHDVSRFLETATRAVVLDGGRLLLDTERDGLSLSECAAEYRRRNR